MREREQRQSEGEKKGKRREERGGIGEAKGEKTKLNPGAKVAIFFLSKLSFPLRDSTTPPPHFPDI